MRPVTAEQRIAARYIPKNALPIEEQGLGVVYVYPSAGKYGAIAYLPKAMKRSWHYSFRTDAQLDKYIAEWFDGLRKHQEYVASNKAARKAPHSFKVGDIVYNSWGYSMTLVDWYRVTKISDSYVWLEQIQSAQTAQGMSEPAIDTTSNDPANWNVVSAGTDRCETGLLNKSHRHHAAGDSIHMKHGCCTKWDGKPKYENHND